MLNLKFQYFGHLMWKANSLEKPLMLGKIEGKRRRGQQRTRWLNGITDWMDMSLSNSRRWWRTGKPVCCSPWGHKESDVTEQLYNNLVKVCTTTRAVLTLIISRGKISLKVQINSTPGPICPYSNVEFCLWEWHGHYNQTCGPSYVRRIGIFYILSWEVLENLKGWMNN